MNQEMMIYKNYTASIRWSDEDNSFVGHVTNLDKNTTISLMGSTLPEIRKDFEEMIEWYLEDCEKDGKEPCLSNREAMAHST